MGCFRRSDKLGQPNSMWVLGGHRIGLSHPKIHFTHLSCSHGNGLCLPGIIFYQAASECPHPMRKSA